MQPVHVLHLGRVSPVALSTAIACCPSLRQVTKMLMECRDELKYSARAIVLLIGIQLVDMKDLDLHLAKAIESGRNLIALSCSIKLINALTVAERSERPLTDVSQLRGCGM